MSNRTTAKSAWRKKKYWKSRYEKDRQRKNEQSRYERERSKIDEQQRSFAKKQEPKEIVKVRMQSTPEKIDSFRRMIEFCQEIGMCEVMNFSDLFSNKGTDKYFRAYTDIDIKEGEDNE